MDIKCSTCDQNYPIEQFYRDFRYKDRICYRPKCKKCYNKTYRNTFLNKNQIIKTCQNCRQKFSVNYKYCPDQKYCDQKCAGSGKANLDYSLTFRKEIQDWIDGFMLSDMHIRDHGAFSFNLKYLEFAQFISSKLFPYQFSIKSYESKSINSGKSRTHPDIKIERERWYSNGTKILPEDCVVNKNSLMGLYLGDGTLHKIRGWIGIYTMNFTWQENEILCEKIKSLGLNCRVKNGSKTQPMIYFSRPNAINFLDYLGTCPVNCYMYKFNMPNKEIANIYQRESRKKRINSQINDHK